MMNIKQNKGLFALLLLAVLTACTSEDNITNSKQLIEVGGDKLKIVINEEPFDVETTTQTRAGGVAQAIPAGTVDLGDGLEAEVSISQGTPAPKTRATVVSDGHYNIYAYDANTNQMLIGPNKKLSGNVVGGVFTPDAGSRLELEAGTYKFVCCTDGVSLDPTYGTGSFWVNVKKEMIGATEQTLSGDGQQIVFLMYHRESRFRFRLIGYTNQLTDVKAQIGIYTGSYRHGYMKIPTGFQGPSTAIGWYYYAEEQPIQATPVRQSTAYPLANEFESDGYSYLSCVDCGLCFNLSGTIYGKTVNIQNKRLDFVHGAAIKDNGSYTINLKLKPTPALYLFEDGTCGALTEKGSRTPIAAVVKEKTATEDGLAIALKDVGNGAWYTYTTPYNWAKMNTQHNTTHYTDANDAVNDMEGYKWTYEAAGSVDGRIKANFEGDYTPFYKTARYTPGVTITGANVGKWYVPAFGEWALAWKVLGKWDGNIPSTPGVPLTMSVSTMNNVFTAVGGSTFQNYDYWCSTEYANEMRPTLSAGGAGFYIGLNATHNLDSYVRPFVHF